MKRTIFYQRERWKGYKIVLKRFMLMTYEPLMTFARKSSISDVWLDPDYASALLS